MLCKRRRQNIQIRGGLIMMKWVLLTSIALSWQFVFSSVNMSNTRQRDIILRFGNTLEEVLAHWKLKNIVGQDEYKVVRHENGNVLHIMSKQSSSLLFKNVDFSIDEYPYIRWHWKVNKFPEYKDSADEYGVDDYAARLCVVFPSWNLLSTKFLVYVWDDRVEKEGEIKPSSLSKNCKILVIEGGDKNIGRWVTEERNINEDYKMLFGKYPRKEASGIGIMSDSDDTKTSTEASYYNIYLHG